MNISLRSVRVLVGSALAFGSAPGSANLIQNGDFEAGATGFRTDYVVAPGDGSLDAGELVVLPPGQQINVPSNISYPDHTTGTGQALYVNGATQADRVVWEQDVTVTPGQAYDFGFFYTNFGFGSGNNDARIAVLADGVAVGNELQTRDAGEGPWFEFRLAIGASSDTLTLGLIETSREASGNDFAIDDLFLTPVPSPAAVLPLIGLAVLRHRRPG
ncbi:MAG: hypothetical protein AAGE65_05520 [Planctomycetota bacterium]